MKWLAVLALAACSGSPISTGGDAGTDFARTGDLAGGGGDLALGGDLSLAGDLAATHYPPDGIWLIGWSGGLNHYSWVRFTAATSTIDLLRPTGNSAWTAYWDCAGSGSFYLAAKPNTVQMLLPAGCPTTQDVLTFTMQPTLMMPMEIYSTTIDENPPTTPLDGHQFAGTQCDPGFTSCTLPM